MATTTIYEKPVKKTSSSATKKTSSRKTDSKATTTKTSAKPSTAKASVSKTSSTKPTATKAAGKVPAKKDAAKDLSDLFEDGLKDIYWAENALLKALPKMIKNVTSAKLKKGMEAHLKQTETHVTRLEDCFKALGKKAQAVKCDAMAGILKEGEGIMEETEMGAVRDAGIIASSQKVEHYEIATYGTLAAFAKILGEKECLKNLLATLKEEKKCDEDLSAMADTELNSKAK